MLDDPMSDDFNVYSTCSRTVIIYDQVCGICGYNIVLYNNHDNDVYHYKSAQERAARGLTRYYALVVV